MIIKKIILNDDGLSLVEILVSILLIGLIASTCLSVFLYAFNNTVVAQEITNQTYGAQAMVEELRSNTYRELIDIIDDDKIAYDSNGDGENDCFVGIELRPFGVGSNPLTSQEAVYLHLLYFVDDVLCVGSQGQSMYGNARGSSTMTLFVEQGSTNCVLTVNGVRLYFNRKSATSPVIVMANLDLKDLGYNNDLVVTGDRSRVEVKSYGNDIIIEEFTSNVTPERFCGVHNLSTSLVRLDVKLYREEASTGSFFSMSEIIEIYNGEKDAMY